MSWHLLSTAYMSQKTHFRLEGSSYNILLNPIKTAAGDILNHLLLFSEKQSLTFHVNGLLGRRFTWNVKRRFLWYNVCYNFAWYLRVTFIALQQIQGNSKARKLCGNMNWCFNVHRRFDFTRSQWNRNDVFTTLKVCWEQLFKVVETRGFSCCQTVFINLTPLL